MAERGSKKQYKDVDQDGIRLAPTPMNNKDINVLPAVHQDFIINPKIVIDEPQDEETKGATTAKDFQPKKQDVSKKWKREKRLKNLIVGCVMFVFTMLALLPFILSPLGAEIEIGFKVLPKDNDIFTNIFNAFSVSIQNNWYGDAVNNVWLNCTKDLILFVGLLCVVLNLAKSLYGIFAAVKPPKYTVFALLYLVVTLILFIMALIGVSEIGIERIYFLRDFIYGFRESEYFTLLVFSVGYFIVSFICTQIDEDKQGYLN